MVSYISLEICSGESINYVGHCFYVVKCTSPLRLLTEHNKQLTLNYSNPALEGTIAVFSCSSSGYLLTGPSTSTCMGNGEWGPDPRQVQCEGKI